MAAKDQHLAQVFKQPPIVAYRRQRNLQNILIKSKVPPPGNVYPRRDTKGITKCGKGCSACPFIKSGREMKIYHKKNMENK